MADPTRARILVSLLQEASYPAQLARDLGLSRTNVSNHLACLRGCGIVVTATEGRRTRYEIADAHLTRALESLMEVVLAVDDGTVTHVGVIAGRGTVSVTHASGVRSTYEPVDATVSTGDRVARGQRIGTVGPESGHCAPAACLHLGARRGPTYLDPMTFFGARRVILLPVR